MGRVVENISRLAVIRKADRASELVEEMELAIVDQNKKIERIHKNCAEALAAAEFAASRLTALELQTDTFWHRLHWLLTGR